ncbi:alpha/beta fold hydrolase [Kineococcus rhizosphaerae]|uniref:alpha/beta fold hydrolase n=1 Tax=Kineococcus rhizosphaerae TaxID=559628 RepID=UPI000D07DE95|nr:alpha/beta hydrolase [Kineococcus rhizosphaerae]
MPRRLTAADMPSGLTVRIDRVRRDGAWLRTWTMWIAETDDVPPQHRHDVVLVHGLGVSSAYFQRLAVELARFGTVHLVELPGFAGVPHPDRRMTTQEMGRLVASWVREQGLTGVLLLGHSMGAQVVTEVALRDPDLVGHVALVGPPVNLEERSVPKQVARLLQAAVFEPPAVRRMSIEGYLRCGWRWIAHTLPSMMRYPIEDRITGVDVPVLVLRGAHDAVAPEGWCRMLADRARKGTFAQVPGAHSVVFDHAREVADHLAGLVTR